MSCHKDPNKKSFWQRAEDIAVRMGIMKVSDRAENLLLDSIQELNLDMISDSYGVTIGEIQSNRKKVDDNILVGHICGLLIEKENNLGLVSFSKAEKTFFIVSDMISQLDSGGFGTYFYNTGHLASELPMSLDIIGSIECKNLVDEAISIYGKVPSDNYDKMIEELSDITNNFDTDPWEAIDSKYYDLEESLGPLLMNYANLNKNEFLL